MRLAFFGSRTSIRVQGKPIPGAFNRQQTIPGFNQEAMCWATVTCVGAGGIISQIAPALVRKGVGMLTILDHDIVEPSNLNRQRFYAKDIGRNKAVALAQNLRPECTGETAIYGYGLSFEEVIAREVDLTCDVAVCGVDNNPARVLATRHFRALGIPVIFAAVSRDADHGYVFVQGGSGPCIGCVFPDMMTDERYPCPGTPAIADILQAVGALAVYAVDTLLMERPRSWNYRRVSLSDAGCDGSALVHQRPGCPLCDGSVLQVRG